MKRGLRSHCANGRYWELDVLYCNLSSFAYGRGDWGVITWAENTGELKYCAAIDPYIINLLPGITCYLCYFIGIIYLDSMPSSSVPKNAADLSRSWCFCFWFFRLVIQHNKGRLCYNSKIDTLISKRLSIENKAKLSQLETRKYLLYSIVYL